MYNIIKRNNDKKIKFLINNFGWESEKTVLVLFSYRSRIVLVSIPYRSPIVLLSFSLPEAETIRKQYGNNMRSIYAGREEDTWWVHGLLHEDDDLFDKEQNNKSE